MSFLAWLLGFNLHSTGNQWRNNAGCAMMLHTHHKTCAGAKGEGVLVLRLHRFWQWEYQQGLKPWFVESRWSARPCVLEKKASGGIWYSSDFKEVEIGFIDRGKSDLNEKLSHWNYRKRTVAVLFTVEKQPHDLWGQVQFNILYQVQDRMIRRDSCLSVLLRGGWGLQRTLSSIQVHRNIEFDISAQKL